VHSARAQARAYVCVPHVHTPALACKCLWCSLAPAARACTRMAATPTADQDCRDSNGGFTLPNGGAGRDQVAAALQTALPGHAVFVYSTLGIAFKSLGDFDTPIDYHTQCLAIAEDVRNRARAGRMRTSGMHIIQRGAFGRRSSTTRRTWRSQRIRATGRGIGNAYQSQGDFDKAIKYHT
jgi:tetratricopeptide (TPR) repeat protein